MNFTADGVAELDTFPLPEPWNTALRPRRVLASSLDLFAAVEALARRQGHADVLDAWGDDIELIRRFGRGQPAG